MRFRKPSSVVIPAVLVTALAIIAVVAAEDSWYRKQIIEQTLLNCALGALMLLVPGYLGAAVRWLRSARRKPGGPPDAPPPERWPAPVPAGPRYPAPLAAHATPPEYEA